MSPIIAADFMKTMENYMHGAGANLIMNICSALVIFFVGKYLAKLLTTLSEGIMRKSQMDETLIKFLGTIIRIGIMVLVVIAALGKLGINTTSFAAILAAAGLAIGLSLQGTLSNFASGVMIILFRPFKVGDFVEIAGSTGVVEEVHIFNTMMKTGDNVQMIIPNGSIIGGKISNYSAKETRRIDLVIGCSYDDDIKAVKEYLEATVTAHEKVLKDPAAVVAVAELGDNSVNFVVRPWVESADYWAVRWDLIESIKVGFDEKGFSFPYPQQDVHMHQAKAD